MSSASASETGALCTALWRLQGQVQGVGMRPFLYNRALACGLSGWVGNRGDEVELLLQGREDQHLRFASGIDRLWPAGAEVVNCVVTPMEGVAPMDGFSLRTSEEAPFSPNWPKDRALCQCCLKELFDPANRRYRYPFIACAQCGPRYSLTRQLPFDRANTSMVSFPMCAQCQSEYENPDDRRFHSQLNTCRQCGPAFFAGETPTAVTDEPLWLDAVNCLGNGGIVALKGLGGFHLICDALNPKAVATLRSRKHRPAQPFAVMVPSLEAASAWVHLRESDKVLLSSDSAPIVLLPLTMQGKMRLPQVVSGLDKLGIMLPHAAWHYLLMDAWRRQENPERTESLPIWVLTSGNASGAPLQTDNEQAIVALDTLADLVIWHSRPIVHRLDDSVFDAIQESGSLKYDRLLSRENKFLLKDSRLSYELKKNLIVDDRILNKSFRFPGYRPLRLGRGASPDRVRLPEAVPCTLALGGWQKNTFCWGQGDDAWISPHVGDLGHPETTEQLVQWIENWSRNFDTPTKIVCDRHPDFFSSQLAEQLATRWHVPLIRVSHHRAHLAAALVEFHQASPGVGLVLDGFGLGDDGQAWGGERYQIADREISHTGSIRGLASLGGDKAAREPWRFAVAFLYETGQTEAIVRRFGKKAAALLSWMSQSSPRHTSSLGRWFDAAAALILGMESCSYEGQAAMQLEALARQGRSHSIAPALVRRMLEGEAATLDLYPLLSAVLEINEPADAARFWHDGVAEGLALWVAGRLPISSRFVVATGGCMQNQLLCSGLAAALKRIGLQLLVPQRVPVNDAGLSLGQLWYAHGFAKAQEN